MQGRLQTVLEVGARARAQSTPVGVLANGDVSDQSLDGYSDGPFRGFAVRMVQTTYGAQYSFAISIITKPPVASFVHHAHLNDYNAAVRTRKNDVHLVAAHINAIMSAVHTEWKAQDVPMTRSQVQPVGGRTKDRPMSYRLIPHPRAANNNKLFSAIGSLNGSDPLFELAYSDAGEQTVYYGAFVPQGAMPGSSLYRAAASTGVGVQKVTYVDGTTEVMFASPFVAGNNVTTSLTHAEDEV